MPCPALSIAIHTLPALPKTYVQHRFINLPFGIAEEKMVFFVGDGEFLFFLVVVGLVLVGCSRVSRGIIVVSRGFSRRRSRWGFGRLRIPTHSHPK